MRLQFLCPTCKKQTFVKSEFSSLKGGAVFYKLDCGHTSHKMHIEKENINWPALTFADNRTLFPFQSQTCMFAESADLSCLIAHEMGLGKTIIATALLFKRSKDMLPVAIFCKKGLVRQWYQELLLCLGPTPIQTINSGKEFPIPKAKIFIVSLDTLHRLDVEKWKSIGIKSIIIDEVQHIKSHEAKRTNAVRLFARETGARILGLSGTPIKNNPGEYYPILNLIRPEKFPTRAQFIHDFCEYKETRAGIVATRLISPRDFKEFTKDFIIRFERAEVMPDLPKVFRTNLFIDMTQDLMESYQEVVREFESFVSMKQAEGKEIDSSNLLAYLAKMRHITGLAKIESVVDFTTDFLLETDRKLVIFLHHKDVHGILKTRIDSFLSNGGMNPCLSLSSDLDPDERHEVVKKFWSSEYRILIASTLASGEGLNLQVCSDAVMMEPQWNPANEEQAEARFTRIGSVAEKVNIKNIVAVGTVDEFLISLKEQKRQSTREALTGETQASWSESEIIRDLTDMVISKSLKSWAFPKEGEKK